MVKMRFNCKDIFDCSVVYSEASDEMISLCKEMKAISNDLEAIWLGEDSQAYISKYNNYIDYLNNISTYLINKSNLLNKASNLHGDVDNELCEQFKRSKIDEQKDRY